MSISKYLIRAHLKNTRTEEVYEAAIWEQTNFIFECPEFWKYKEFAQNKYSYNSKYCKDESQIKLLFYVIKFINHLIIIRI